MLLPTYLPPNQSLSNPPHLIPPTMIPALPPTITAELLPFPSLSSESIGATPEKPP
ncbi:hypothetical protein B0H19DRAFT_1096988 [Mycena capillaripes]|nr:hypothetical protein B0H19DRAFT_1096988 [Mycena capillaripes]